jgi:GTP-binding protein EngB required for normal cell division
MLQMTRRLQEMTESLRLVKERICDVRPTKWPTQQQFDAIKEQYEYSPQKFHIAVSGNSGTGKSSLINSLRGLYPYDQEAADTNDIECTMTVTRYPDPDPRKNVVWFDVPGAGTQSHPEAQYFNDKGLYIFDAILVIFGDRFASTDIAILRQCALYNIPSYIVRTKADIHVRNRYEKALNAERRKRKKGKRELSKDESDRVFEEEKRAFKEATKASVEKELEYAGLPIQPVFIVSSEGLLSATREMMSKVADAVMEKEDEAMNKSEDDNEAQRDGRGEDEDEDADEIAPPYVVFDEQRLLGNMMYTSYLTRVPKDSQWLKAMTKRFSSWSWGIPDVIKNIFSKIPWRAHESEHDGPQETT